MDGDPDEAPEPPAEPISKPGDLWICGEHRVLCGDARVLADVEKVLGGELADMCFTDPPYNVNYASSKQKLRGKKRPIMNDALGNEFGAFLFTTLASAFNRPSEATMRVIPIRFASASSRVANTGSRFAFAVAYFLFALMLLFQIADLIISIVRAW